MNPRLLCPSRPSKESGLRFEERVGEALAAMGLVAYGRHVHVGDDPMGGRALLDWLVGKPVEPDLRAALSCKFQDSAGSTDEKLAGEIIRLLHMLDTNPHIACAHLVIGGSGWSPDLDRYLNVVLPRLIPRSRHIRIHLGLESLTAGPFDTTPTPR